MDFSKIFFCIAFAYAAGVIVNYIVDKWQALPIKEEASTPIYITKEIKCD
jgi:hypothetical protein